MNKYTIFVHLSKNKVECLIKLVGEGGNSELREFYDMKRKEVAKAIGVQPTYAQNRTRC